jgi:hypothetical protein
MKINLEAIISDSNLINLLLISSISACIVLDRSSVIPVSLLVFKVAKDAIEAFKATKETSTKQSNLLSKLEEIESKISHLSNKDAAKEIFSQMGNKR